MKKLLAYIFIFFAFSTTLVFADVNLTGLIPGQIWYSKDPFVEGETIKIYTAIWNSDRDPITVNVNFYDKDVILGTKDVLVPAESIKDVSIFWKVTTGDHLISARIASSSISSGGKKLPVQLNRSSTEEDSRFIKANIKTQNGDVVSSANIAKSQIDKLPSAVSGPLLSSLDTVESFRENTHTKIDDIVAENQKIINTVDAPVSMDTLNEKGDIKVLDGARLIKDELKDAPKKKSPIEAPMAYLKVFVFTSLGMIFANKLVFYGLLCLIIFLVIRFIYRKIRNR